MNVKRKAIEKVAAAYGRALRNGAHRRQVALGYALGLIGGAWQKGRPVRPGLRAARIIGQASRRVK